MRRSHQRGATILEFALTLPPFLLLFGGVIDCGWLFFQQSALDSSAHLGCRGGAMLDSGVNDVDLNTMKTATDVSIRAAMHQASLGCNSCVIMVETLYSTPARSLRCTVTNDYEPLIGVLPAFALNSRAIVRMEIQR